MRAVRTRKKNIGVDDKKLMNIRSVDCVLTSDGRGSEFFDPGRIGSEFF